MKVMQRIERMLRAIDVAIALAKFIVFLVAALMGFVVVAVALVAYLTREQWAEPACRWARDTSGRWAMTPWTSVDKTAG